MKVVRTIAQCVWVIIKVWILIAGIFTVGYLVARSMFWASQYGFLEAVYVFAAWIAVPLGIWIVHDTRKDDARPRQQSSRRLDQTS